MQRTPFKQVDVFTHMPFMGNPVAVVLDAQGLSTAQMQQVARWTNLSETTFVLPATQPQADYRVRIFTPRAELPFAGHPTLGTAHALLESGRIAPRDGRLVQECAAGLIDLAVTSEPGSDRWIAFTMPPATVTLLTPDKISELEAALGHTVRRDVPPRLIDVGPRWIVAQLPSADEVMAIRPDFVRLTQQDVRAQATGVVVFGEHAPGHPGRIEVRAFAPSLGVEEDPVCGSGNGCVAVFIRETGQMSHFGSEFVSSQGAVVGRAGRVRITFEGPNILVGGASLTCVEGHLSL
jgi:PhzF family phenazine biosynthesis protein